MNIQCSCLVMSLIFSCSMFGSVSAAVKREDNSATNLTVEQEAAAAYEYPPSHPYAGLHVPFYLYAGGDFDVFWKSCKKPIFSKAVEVSFLMHLQDHPWRTFDPEEAALFVIPGLFSLLFTADQGCSLPLENMTVSLANAVKSSKWFRRYEGRDHLMVVGYFKAEKFLKTKPEWVKILKNITLGGHTTKAKYIGRNHPGQMVSVGHQTALSIGNGSLFTTFVNNTNDLSLDRPLSQEELDQYARTAFEPKARSLFMLGQANNKKYYTNRVMAVKKLGRIGKNNFIVASRCGDKVPFKHCTVNVSKGEVIVDRNKYYSNCCLQQGLSYGSFFKQMTMSNFSLVMSGGDPGTSRFFDAIVASVPQLVISKEFYTHYTPFSCHIPWRNITQEIDVAEFVHDPKKAVSEALRKAESRRDEMIRLQQRFILDVDWLHPKSLAPNNLIVQTIRQCYPPELFQQSPVLKLIKRNYLDKLEKCIE